MIKDTKKALKKCLFSKCGPEVTVSPHAQPSICCGWVSENDRQGHGSRFSSCFYGAFMAMLRAESIKFLNISAASRDDSMEKGVCDRFCLIFSFLLWRSKLNMNPCDVVQNEAKKVQLFSALFFFLPFLLLLHV